MPGKSRRRKGRYLAKSKRRKAGLSHPTVAIQQQAVVQAREPVPLSKVPTPSAGMPAQTAKPAAMRYQNVATELRTIGILAGILLVILIVLALVPLPW
jgi:hypothetical protein